MDVKHFKGRLMNFQVKIIAIHHRKKNIIVGMVCKCQKGLISFSKMLHFIITVYT